MIWNIKLVLIQQLKYNQQKIDAWSFSDHLINSSPPGQNGCHFAKDIFRCIFVNKKFCIFIKISLNFVPEGRIDNNPALI